MRPIRLLLFLVALMMTGGCAKYQFSIVEPAELAGDIERKGYRAVNRPPLEYTFYDLGTAALGVRIANTADDPVQLIGDRSYIVDPDGQTHQMSGGTIAPRSFIEFGLPPTVRVYRPGPRFSIGVGAGQFHRGFYSGFGTVWGPPYYDDTFITMRSWNWRVGDVRLHMEFELEDERFVHGFLFRRQRID